jgi:hypothetical protein
MLYKSLIRSTLDYECQAYNSGCRTYLQKLDRIQQSALNIALRAHRSTEKSLVLLESGELPLNLCRLQLSLRYWVRISTNTENPANKLLQLPYTHTHTLAPKQTDCGKREGEMVHLATKYGSTKILTGYLSHLPNACYHCYQWRHGSYHPYSLYQHRQCNHKKHDNPRHALPRVPTNLHRWQ